MEAIETGAETAVVIARNGRARRLGVARGQFTVPDSIDASNPLIATEASSVLAAEGFGQQGQGAGAAAMGWGDKQAGVAHIGSAGAVGQSDRGLQAARIGGGAAHR